MSTSARRKKVKGPVFPPQPAIPRLTAEGFRIEFDVRTKRCHEMLAVSGEMVSKGEFSKAFEIISNIEKECGDLGRIAPLAPTEK